MSIDYLSFYIICYNISMVWIDLGCDDFEAAKRNRERKLTVEQLRWWLWYENTVRSWSYKKPLPFWIPQGRLPKIGKWDARYLSDHGMHVID